MLSHSTAPHGPKTRRSMKVALIISEQADNIQLQLFNGNAIPGTPILVIDYKAQRQIREKIMDFFTEILNEDQKSTLPGRIYKIRQTGYH